MIQAIRAAMANASSDGRIMQCGNTEVRHVHHGIAHTAGYYREVEVRLFGNLIAVVEPDLSRIRLSDCGYRTTTTKSRLNALLSVFVPGERIWQSDWRWYSNQGEWDGQDEWPIRLDADNWALALAERLAG